MSNVTITLTQDQAHSIIIALEYMQDFDNYKKTDLHNRYLQRVINKVKKHLAKAKS